MPNSGTKTYSATVGGTAAQVSGNGATITGWSLLNTTAAVAYLQFFNLPAASVTVGTTTPLFSVGLPASGGSNMPFPDGLILGGLGLTVAGTTGRANSTGANIDVNLFLK